MAVLLQQLGERLLHLLAARCAGAESQRRHLVPRPGLCTDPERARHTMVVGGTNDCRIGIVSGTMSRLDILHHSRGHDRS